VGQLWHNGVEGNNTLVMGVLRIGDNHVDAVSPSADSAAWPIGLCRPKADTRSDDESKTLLGRKDQLRRVFEKTADGLYRFILFRVGGNRDWADDLLQQTCHEAAKSRKVPSDDAECEAWLRGVAKNLIRKHWRKMKRNRENCSLENAALSQQFIEDMESRPIPPDVLASAETNQQLMLAVTKLSGGDQGLVFAFYFQGRSHTEIAQASGTTTKSIEALLYRVRSRLRSMLHDIERT
jgi:RNA polymerase sigma-70 factor (ECF subfamily)